jgi:hypothetical protein
LSLTPANLTGYRIYGDGRFKIRSGR